MESKRRKKKYFHVLNEILKRNCNRKKPSTINGIVSCVNLYLVLCKFVVLNIYISKQTRTYKHSANTFIQCYVNLLIFYVEIGILVASGFIDLNLFHFFCFADLLYCCLLNFNYKCYI